MDLSKSMEDDKEKLSALGDLLAETMQNITSNFRLAGVVVVYHVTIVAIGHGLLKKFLPLLLGCVLRTAGSSII